MSATAEAPPRTSLTTKAQTADAIRPLLGDEPLSAAAIKRMLPEHGYQIARSSDLVANALQVLATQDAAREIPRRGWVRVSSPLRVVSDKKETAEVIFEPDWDMIPLDQLRIDEYQRPLASMWRKIAANLDKRKFGFLQVSQRGAKDFVIVDGQTRWKGATAILPATAKVPCMVYKGLTRAEEAMLFASLQRDRTNIVTGDRFRAELFAANELLKEGIELTGEVKIVYEVNALVTSYGYEIGSGVGQIKGVGALEHCWKTDDFLLGRVLSTFKAAWPEVVPDGKHIRGLFHFFKNYPLDTSTARRSRTQAPKPVNDEQLIRKLKGAKPEGLETKATAIRPMFEGKNPAAERIYGMAFQAIYGR